MMVARQGHSVTILEHDGEPLPASPEEAWIARLNALIAGRPEPQPTDPRARVGKALSVAMMYDADLFRAANEIRSLLALPQEVIGRPGLVDRIMEVASTHEAVTPPGPSRKELIDMLA
jgi:hypothetical protein